MRLETHFAPAREARNAPRMPRFSRFDGLTSGFGRQNFGFCNFRRLREQFVGFGK